MNAVRYISIHIGTYSKYADIDFYRVHVYPSGLRNYHYINNLAEVVNEGI